MTLVEQLLAGTLDLAGLSADELATLRTSLAEAFTAADPGQDTAPSDDQLAEMARIAEATEHVQGEAAQRAAAAQRVDRAGELRRRVTPPAPPEPPAPPAEPSAQIPAQTAPTSGGEGGVGLADPATADTREPELVTASAVTVPAPGAVTVTPTLAQLAQQARPTPPARTAPRRVEVAATLTAAANMPGLGLGAPVGWRDLSVATREKLRALGSARSEERHIVASLTWDYPEDRRLTDDAWANSALMDAALSVDAVMESVAEQGGIEAVVAAGGICGPTPVDYGIMVDVSQARPLRDGLPAFQATRGGLRFVPPPSFASVGSSATAVWTSANDASPSSPSTKPVQEFACPTPVEVLVDAIPTRLQFSNFSARYGPEIVEANTTLAMANAARIAEVNLLTKMAAGSIITGSTAVLSSFTRDLLAQLELYATGFRYRHRLPADYPMEFVAPSWVLGAIRTDILRELAHDRSNASSDQLGIANSYIVSQFAVRNIVPRWTLDGLGKSVAGTTLSAGNAWDYPDQTFIAPATTAALSAAPPDASAGSAAAGTWWPKRLTYFLYPAGTWVFLDGGRIDLGVIRDSTLNATNKYQTFVEPFEGLAKRGVESLQVTVPVNLTGTSVAAAAAPSAASAYVF